MVHTPRRVIEVHHLLLASSVMFWEYRNFAIYGPNTHDVSALMKTMPQFDEQTASTYTHICKHKTSQNKIKGHTHTHKKKKAEIRKPSFPWPRPEAEKTTSTGYANPESDMKFPPKSRNLPTCPWMYTTKARHHWDCSTKPQMGSGYRYPLSSISIH